MSYDPNHVVLSVRDLSASYLARRGRVRAVSNVSFDLHAGETLAVIGESGCGKSTLNLALIRQLPQSASIDSGSVTYTYRDGRQVDLLTLSKREMRAFLWSECSMVFQGALNSLNPVIRISDMVYDTGAAHGIKRADARKRALKLFEQVRLDPERVFRSYPHELSGGMRQRVLLALSLILRPQIVIMDEPTTAVDILTQRSILDVLKLLREELNFSVMFISHDLAVAAEIADTVATMYAGEIVEIGNVDDVFYRSHHAYTYSLLNAAPRLSVGAQELTSIPGSPPDLIEPPSGCKFHPRCTFARDICQTEPPALVAYQDGQRAACHETARVLEAQAVKNA
ncbi:MAG: ABC transporter ATP-binding protein [Anaerolineaceae bacterium]|nr:ABC transporter ATP-binding protein [Anaerolineaceae bacterium]